MSETELQRGSRQIRSPILVVGSPRSGTTMLGNILGTHPDVAYWEEPRPIWSQGHAWRADDFLGEDDLTPAIARRIDRHFARYLAASGKSRFCEKTPSNCLRLRFIHALYPDARVIHLIRDGRAVAASMLRMLEKPPDSGRVVARLRETPWRDLPALVPVFFRDVMGLRLTGRKPFWGPRPPGWREWLDLPLHTMLARQWSVLARSARRDLELFPAENRLEIRYEDFVSAPAEWLERIFSATGLASSPGFVAHAAGAVSGGHQDEWRRDLGDEAIAGIETEAGSLLKELGYQLLFSTDS
jgi:hypothetical protein